MFGYNPATIGLAAKRKAKKETMFDGIKKAVEQVAIDLIDERMAITLNANMRQAALSIVFQLAMIMSEGQGVDPEDELLPNELLDGLMTDAFDEDGDEIEEAPNLDQLNAFAKAYQLFINSIEQHIQTIQQHAFERYQKLYAHYYEMS